MNDLEAVKVALENGANPRECINGTPLIHYACELGYLQIVCALLDHGENIDRCATYSNSHSIPCLTSFTVDFSTPLHNALFHHHEDIVKELIKRGADVNKRTGVGTFISSAISLKTPLEIAVSTGQFNCCKQIIDAGAVIKKIGSSLLTEACSLGTYAIVELLLNSGLDPKVSRPGHPSPSLSQNRT